MRPCRHAAFEAVPKRKVDLNLDECERVLGRSGYEVVANPKVMLVVKKGVEITVYPHGRLLMYPVSNREDAERIATELYSVLGR